MCVVLFVIVRTTTITINSFVNLPALRQVLFRQSPHGSTQAEKNKGLRRGGDKKRRQEGEERKEGRALAVVVGAQQGDVVGGRAGGEGRVT